MNFCSWRTCRLRGSFRNAARSSYSNVVLGDRISFIVQLSNPPLILTLGLKPPTSVAIRCLAIRGRTLPLLRLLITRPHHFLKGPKLFNFIFGALWDMAVNRSCRLCARGFAICCWTSFKIDGRPQGAIARCGRILNLLSFAWGLFASPAMVFVQVKLWNLRLERWIRFRGIVAGFLQLLMWGAGTESINWFWAAWDRSL